MQNRVVLAKYEGNKDISLEELSGLSDEDLLELKDLVDTDITSISIQIDDAKAIAASGGEYADVGWYRRAVTAKKLKGRLSQRIQTELSNKKKRRKEKHGEGTTELFIRGLFLAMDEHLSSELKDRIVSDARAYQLANSQ